MYGAPQKESTCSLIEAIARETKNTKKVVIEKLGKQRIQKIIDLAEVYHCENIEKVVSEWIEEAQIPMGTYDLVAACQYNVPSYWDIGKVYQRLILMVNDAEKNYAETLTQVLTSWIVEKIDNDNSSMYYENPGYIYACYEEGKVL